MGKQVAGRIRLFVHRDKLSQQNFQRVCNLVEAYQGSVETGKLGAVVHFDRPESRRACQTKLSQAFKGIRTQWW
jgi:hypothetical protein